MDYMMERALIFFAVLLASFFAMLILVILPLAAVTDAGCNAAGWPDARVNFNFTRYCVRRVDQTDIIVPYKERNK